MRRANLTPKSLQNGLKNANPAAIATLGGFLFVLVGAGIVVARNLLPETVALPKGIENLSKLPEAPPIPDNPVELAFGTDKPDWNMADFNVDETVNNPSVYQNVSKEVARQINLSLPFTSDISLPAAPFFLKAKTQIDADRAQHCLSLAVYFEAASESVGGQYAVAQVVLNRLRHPAWPHTVCGVVFQGSERRTGCQFSFTCDGSLSRRPSGRAWLMAQGVASAALHGNVMPEVGHATHYHTDWVAPYWAPSLRKLKQIGTHIFYTWKGDGGNPRVFRDIYQGSEVWPRLAALSAPQLGAPDAVQAVIDGAAGVNGGVNGAAPGLGSQTDGVLGTGSGYNTNVPNFTAAGGADPKVSQTYNRAGAPNGARSPSFDRTQNARLESEAARSLQREPQGAASKAGPNGLMAEPDLETLLPKYNLPAAPAKKANPATKPPEAPKGQEKRARAMDGL